MVFCDEASENPTLSTQVKQVTQAQEKVSKVTRLTEHCSYDTSATKLLHDNTLSETEPLLNSASCESDEEVDKELDELDEYIPMSLLCNSKEMKTIIYQIYGRYKMLFYINLCFLLFYIAVSILSVVTYVKYQSSCHSVHQFGESCIGITAYLTVWFLLTTTATLVNWVHCKRLLMSQTNKKRECKFKYLGNQVVSNVKTHKDTDKFFNLLLQKMKSKPVTTFTKVFKMSNFISRHKLHDAAIQKILQTNKKHRNNFSNNDMEIAIQTARNKLKMQINSQHDANDKITQHFQAFFFGVNVLPVISTMFWILVGVDALKETHPKHEICRAPLIIFWVITVLVTLISIAPIALSILYFFSNGMKSYQKVRTKG